MTSSDSVSAEFPAFLRDYGDFLSHLTGLLDPLSNMDKGTRFAKFVQGIVRHTEVGRRFNPAEMQPASHDGGVDLVATSVDSPEELRIQSKYTIAGKDDIELIISKFKNYEENRRQADSRPTQLVLPNSGSPIRDPKPAANTTAPAPQYVIATASKLVGTDKLRNYETSQLTSVKFYQELQAEGRIHLLDGPAILKAAQAAYRKRHFLPTQMKVRFATQYITKGNVYVGILQGSQLRQLYDTFGDALFLENIREYLGPSTGKVQKSERKTVNEAIEGTIKSSPDKFLSRNNGITFRANRVTPQSDGLSLELDQASIVNGCQTTMSIWNAGDPGDDCLVLAKIVETDDAWDIAGSANFQTVVDRIDLDVARYVRSQALNEAAVKYGFQLRKPTEAPESLFAVFNAISRAEIAEEEVRALFIGLFSRSPENAVRMNYSELDNALLDGYEADPEKDRILLILFRINEQISVAADQIQQSRQLKRLVEVFKRFWSTKTKNTPRYRAFLAILAACGAVGENFFASSKHTYDQLRQFLLNVDQIIDTNPDVFLRSYDRAFRAVAVKVIDQSEDVEKTVQTMSTAIEQAKFDMLYLTFEAVN